MGRSWAYASCLFVMMAFTVALYADAKSSAPKETGEKEKAVSNAPAQVPDKENSKGKGDQKATDNADEETNSSDAEKKEEAKSSDKKEEKKEPKTLTIKESPLRIEMKISGMFEAEKATEVSYDPKAWKTLKVAEAVEPGTEVKKGDRLIKFDLEDLEKAIANLQLDVKLSDISIETAEAELEYIEKATPLDLEYAERRRREGDEDLERFLSVDRPYSQEQAHMNVRRWRDSLEYEKEELGQLEKMYNADDLTEETEEIVLRRQRDRVATAEFGLRGAELNRDQFLDVSLPRRSQMLRDSVTRTRLELQSIKDRLPLMVAQRRLALQKLKDEHKKSSEHLSELQGDLEILSATAPASGIVYYGRCVRGKWTTGSTLESQLRPGGMVKANQVLMTIVERRPMNVRASIDEKDLWGIKEGVDGIAVPTAFPDEKLEASIASVTPLPLPNGKYDATIDVSFRANHGMIVPGMTCELEFVTFYNPESILVPETAVFQDDESEESREIVYVVDEEGEATKRDVVLGKKSKGKVAILEGIKKGEKILLEKPKDDEKD
ncbi:macrolide transporter subunit MacA [Planctomycetes bacterium Pan216]|uniref:Macrolide transporter subunit MacA n=1 Tax=Kolteria novifilia TaxID=2527975 RepID=A0A518B6L6_9BACT|nr:macrolide transporter subunit MacA [Planctomycetes bacterium Pan216]